MQVSFHQWRNYRGLSQGEAQLNRPTCYCGRPTSQHSEKTWEMMVNPRCGWLY